MLRRQRVAAMQAEREQQRQAKQEQPDKPETRAPERRGGQVEWVEEVKNGERYRHRTDRPDEIYWQNPSGEWHLQAPEGECDLDDYGNDFDY